MSISSHNNPGNSHHYRSVKYQIARAASVLLFICVILAIYARPWAYNNVEQLDNTIKSTLTGPGSINSAQIEPASQHPEAHLCKSDDSFRYYLPISSNAKCIDGSRPAFYLRKGKDSGKSRWIVYFEGGGWCFDANACFQRSLTNYGTSKYLPRCLAGSSQREHLNPDPRLNPLMHNWNAVHVRYCDGASYAGETNITYQGEKLYFHGRINRDETIRMLLNLGMINASEVVINGCSAGALAIFLGLDQMANIIHEANSSIVVRGFQNSGFFMEYSSNELLSNSMRGRDDAIVNGSLNYALGMRSLFSFANMSAGANPTCLSKAKEPSDCVFAANLSPHIKTPVFHAQPQYDFWQLIHILSRNASYHSVNQFGQKLTKQMMETVFYPDNPGHGGFIESCAHHCFSCSDSQENLWTGSHMISTQEKFNYAQSFAAWYLNSLPVSLRDKHFKQKLSKKNESMINSTTMNTHLSLDKWLSNSMNSSNTFQLPIFNLYLQNFSYPCHNCCLCQAKPFVPNHHSRHLRT